LVHDCLRFEMS
jgi:hypothetical protein